MTTLRRVLFIAVLLPVILANDAIPTDEQSRVDNANDKSNSTQGCTITIGGKNPQTKFADQNVILYEFDFFMFNYTKDPLHESLTTENYKPWRWFRTESRHGRTLLMLSFHYDVLSMNILNIGVEKQEVPLVDTPFGCFGELTAQKRVDIIRNVLFDHYDYIQSRTVEDIRNPFQQAAYVCNEIVREDDGYGAFVNRCCERDEKGILECSDLEEDFWILVLYVCIALVKLLVFFFSPLLIPETMYSATYMASEYVVKLSKELKMKLFITENAETSVRYRKRLTLDDVSEWTRFVGKLDDFPRDEIIPIKMPELRVKVKGKRIIPENDPPTGLMKTFYDNLIRCKIKNLDPFSDCCDRSVYASLEPKIKHQLSWHFCCQIFVKFLILILLPTPYYIRIFIFYRFEEKELLSRKDALDDLGLKSTFQFYRQNLIQYLSPTHGLFLATYCFYFVTGLGTGFMNDAVRLKLKTIARGALHDMQNVSRTSVLQVLLRFMIWPFRKFGLFGILLAPAYLLITTPFCSLIFVIYCIPTIYLSYRMMYNARKKIQVYDKSPTRPLTKRQLQLMHMQEKLKKIDQQVHTKNSGLMDGEDRFFPYTWGSGILCSIRRVCIQLIMGLYCLACLYAVVLLIVEAAGLAVEVMAFTMMGIIVNAGSTLRYVSMVLLVFVYMHDCYNNVYENYLVFNKSVIEEIMDKTEDLKKYASLPSSMQENAAFQLKPLEVVDQIPTGLNFEKKEPRWRIGHLLLFLDSFDTPRIPLRFFKKLCEIRIHGAPGPVYANLLSATAKFLTIVIFLFFVVIVVMAFGNMHRISSTNQTLATMAGGFVPMLLKNVLSSKSIKLNLKTLSFKGQIDEIISEYKQYWPICDLVIEKDVTEEKEPGSDDESVNDRDTEKEKEKDENTQNNTQENKANDISKEDPISMKGEEGEKDWNSIDTSTVPFLPRNGSISRLELEKRLSRASSIIADNYVDLFIDLGVSDSTKPWDIYGSYESLGSHLQGVRYKSEAEIAVPEIKIEVFD